MQSIFNGFLKFIFVNHKLAFQAMVNFYIILVVVLFALAISDLIVGVANDAVNFLNSAVGSKAAPKWLIFFVAVLGILIGAAFSNGMMEVARKGIFHPEMFFFSEIMVIFLAVMITDVIMLDTFNALGLPTSTTVSVVFELLGAAVAIAIVKIKLAGGSAFVELSQYINSDKALAIISGILVSVVIAFTVGALVQYIARLIFTFNYRQPMKYFGSLFGGLAITTITYFMLVKGISDSSFAEINLRSGGTLSEWITGNTISVMIYSFLGWTVIMQVLKWIFNVKILKVVVLAGTFALAMAFAGNDLVNFIGVPLAGFNSFEAWMAAGNPAPDGFSMGILSGEVNTPGYMLLISGLVMITTLIFSRKARTVIATELNLARQSEGTEKFESSILARVIVRSTSNFNSNVKKLVPGKFLQVIESRFKPSDYFSQTDQEPPAFDKIRASVNLVVASILIALGTSLKLPLSTTYVTFMVAMGTSLSDRAWDRDSAVFRISGVIAVISGWFLTALIAFTGAAFIALIISLGGNFMIFVFIALAIFMVVRTHLLFKNRNRNSNEDEEDVINLSDNLEVFVAKSTKQVLKALTSSSYIIYHGINGFLDEDADKIKSAQKTSFKFSKRAKSNKEKVYTTVQVLSGGMEDSSHYYVHLMDYKRLVANSAHFIINPVVTYFNNNHKPFTLEQKTELLNLTELTGKFFDLGTNIIKESRFEKLDSLVAERENIFELLEKLERNQIKRIKNKQVNTRNSILFFKIISETKNILLQSVNMMKEFRDFITYIKKP